MKSGEKRRLIFGQPLQLSEDEQDIWDEFLDFIEYEKEGALPSSISDEN